MYDKQYSTLHRGVKCWIKVIDFVINNQGAPNETVNLVIGPATTNTPNNYFNEVIFYLKENITGPGVGNRNNIFFYTEDHVPIMLVFQTISNITDNRWSLHGDGEVLKTINYYYQFFQKNIGKELLVYASSIASGATDPMTYGISLFEIRNAIIARAGEDLFEHKNVNPLAMFKPFRSSKINFDTNWYKNIEAATDLCGTNLNYRYYQPGLDIKNTYWSYSAPRGNSPDTISYTGVVNDLYMEHLYLNKQYTVNVDTLDIENGDIKINDLIEDNNGNRYRIIDIVTYESTKTDRWGNETWSYIILDEPHNINRTNDNFTFYHSQATEWKRVLDYEGYNQNAKSPIQGDPDTNFKYLNGGTLFQLKDTGEKEVYTFNSLSPIENHNTKLVFDKNNVFSEKGELRLDPLGLNLFNAETSIYPGYIFKTHRTKPIVQEDIVQLVEAGGGTHPYGSYLSVDKNSGYKIGEKIKIKPSVGIPAGEYTIIDLEALNPEDLNLIAYLDKSIPVNTPQFLIKPVKVKVERTIDPSTVLTPDWYQTTNYSCFNLYNNYLISKHTHIFTSEGMPPLNYNSSVPKGKYSPEQAIQVNINKLTDIQADDNFFIGEQISINGGQFVVIDIERPMNSMGTEQLCFIILNEKHNFSGTTQFLQITRTYFGDDVLFGSYSPNIRFSPKTLMNSSHYMMTWDNTGKPLIKGPIPGFDSWGFNDLPTDYGLIDGDKIDVYYCCSKTANVGRRYEEKTENFIPNYPYENIYLNNTFYFNSKEEFPIPGKKECFYIDVTSNTHYKWTGSSYELDKDITYYKCNECGYEGIYISHLEAGECPNCTSTNISILSRPNLNPNKPATRHCQYLVPDKNSGYCGQFTYHTFNSHMFDNSTIRFSQLANGSKCKSYTLWDPAESDVYAHPKIYYPECPWTNSGVFPFSNANIVDENGNVTDKLKVINFALDLDLQSSFPFNEIPNWNYDAAIMTKITYASNQWCATESGRKAPIELVTETFISTWGDFVAENSYICNTEVNMGEPEWDADRLYVQVDLFKEYQYFVGEKIRIKDEFYTITDIQPFFYLNIDYKIIILNHPHNLDLQTISDIDVTRFYDHSPDISHNIGGGRLEEKNIHLFGSYDANSGGVKLDRQITIPYYGNENGINVEVFISNPFTPGSNSPHFIKIIDKMVKLSDL